MQASNFLVELLWKEVHVILVCLGLLPILQQIKLCKSLVGEGTRHHEGRMAGCTTKVQQTPSSKHDDSVAIRELE